jgi:NADH-quinone oxidoreductase subunit E
MSVRRLADDSIQPARFAFTRENEAWARKILKNYPKGREASAVIPLLMRAQEQEGWVSRAAIEHVANRLGMPYIRALEVATFYTQFQLQPVGTRAHVQVCGTTPCMLRGANDLIAICKEKIHPEPHHTNAEGTMSWEEVECLGACVNAPMVMIFKDTYEDLTPERFCEILDAFEQGRGHEIRPGPQNGRVFSAPASGLTSLIDERAIMRGGAAGGPAGKAGRETKVPPSAAARPRTDALETASGLRSPSPRKASARGETAASAQPPAHDQKAADKVPPQTGNGRQRAHAGRRTGDPSRKAASEPGRPPVVARPAEPDDLKMISGIGPKLEKTLNELGIHTFAQIAAWTKAEREWVDGYLKFKGRIERDDWVGQAKALAKGGAAEYERVFGKKPR